MKWLQILFLFFPIALLVLKSNIIRATDLDTYLSSLKIEQGASFSIGVYKNGRSIYKKSKGIYRLSEPRTFQSNDVFRIGSLSKQFTGYAIFKLAQKGLIHLNDTLDNYIPILKSNKSVGKLTIDQVLRHEAALPNFPPFSKPGEFRTRYVSLDEYEKILPKVQLIGHPGTFMKYSNLGYIILSILIEKISKQPLNDFLHQLIFSPLGMTSTLLDSPPHLPEGINKRLSDGLIYQSHSNQYEKAPKIKNSSSHGSGAAVSTIDDMGRWGTFLLNNVLIEYPKQEYAFGLFYNDSSAESYYHHGGSTIGFIGRIWIIPSRKKVIVLLTNATNGFFNRNIMENIFRLAQ